MRNTSIRAISFSATSLMGFGNDRAFDVRTISDAILLSLPVLHEPRRQPARADRFNNTDVSPRIVDGVAVDPQRLAHDVPPDFAVHRVGRNHVEVEGIVVLDEQPAELRQLAGEDFDALAV